VGVGCGWLGVWLDVRLDVWLGIRLGVWVVSVCVCVYVYVYVYVVWDCRSARCRCVHVVSVPV
jgi:hypothetical protein